LSGFDSGYLSPEPGYAAVAYIAPKRISIASQFLHQKHDGMETINFSPFHIDRSSKVHKQGVKKTILRTTNLLYQKLEQHHQMIEVSQQSHLNVFARALGRIAVVRGSVAKHGIHSHRC